MRAIPHSNGSQVLRSRQHPLQHVQVVDAAGFDLDERFPSVPTISSHKGFPGFNYDIWIGVQVPKATPDGVVDRINAAMNAVLQNTDVRKGIEGTGSVLADPQKRADLDKLYAVEIDRYRAMAKGINLSPQ